MHSQVQGRFVAMGQSYWSRNWLAICSLLLIYTLVYAPSVVARISNSEFMEIDPRSIMNSIDGLTTGPVFYNMNDQYHSQYYGWTYFALNFVVVMLLKIFGFTSEVNINVVVRFLLFSIGAGLVAQAYYVAQSFFSRNWSIFITLVAMFNPVSAHYFVTIHPESLGMLCQLISIGFFISIYKSAPEFPLGKYLLAVAALSLSAVSKHPFLIVGIFVYITFFICYATIVKSTTAPMTLWRFGMLTLLGVVILAVVFFVIHPYAAIEPERFLQAQSVLFSEHATVRPFSEVWSAWLDKILSNYLVLLNFILLPFVIFSHRAPIGIKLSVAFACVVVAIFVFKERRFINVNYIYPVYFVLFFNAFYYFVEIAMPFVRRLGGKALSYSTQALCLAAFGLVLLSNLLFTVTETHQRFLLDGLDTAHATWEKIKGYPQGTRVVFSPNLAVIEQLTATSCSAWSGCGDRPAIKKFDPDLVIFSPSYPYFDSSEFEAYVSENGFELVDTIISLKMPELGMCAPTAPSILQAPSSVLWYYAIKPMRCFAAYRAGLRAHLDGKIVQGFDALIYAKDR